MSLQECKTKEVRKIIFRGDFLRRILTYSGFAGSLVVFAKI